VKGITIVRQGSGSSQIPCPELGFRLLRRIPFRPIFHVFNFGKKKPQKLIPPGCFLKKKVYLSKLEKACLIAGLLGFPGKPVFFLGHIVRFTFHGQAVRVTFAT
jgi:hypothetical protein